MLTNDECREVAARLRDYIGFDFGDSDPFWYMNKAVYGDVKHLSHEFDNELFARLADLIEPEERRCSVEEPCSGELEAPASDRGRATIQRRRVV